MCREGSWVHIWTSFSSGWKRHQWSGAMVPLCCHFVSILIRRVLAQKILCCGIWNITEFYLLLYTLFIYIIILMLDQMKWNCKNSIKSQQHGVLGWLLPSLQEAPERELTFPTNSKLWGTVPLLLLSEKAQGSWAQRMLVEPLHAPWRVPVPLLLGLLFKELFITRNAGEVFCCCYFVCCQLSTSQSQGHLERGNLNWESAFYQTGL